MGVLPVAEVGASAPRTSAERAAEEAPIRRVRALRQAACCALRPRAAKPARVRLFPESPQPSTGELGYRDSRRHLLLIDPPPQGRKRERTCGVACRVSKARRNTATCPIEHACARGVPCTLFWGSRYIQDSALGCPLIGWADAAAHCASEWSSCVIKQAKARTSLALSLPPHAWRLAPSVPPPPPRLQPKLQLPPAPAHTSCTDTAAQNRATPRRTSSSSCLRRFLQASSRSLACLRRHGAAVLKRAARMAQGRYLQCFTTI